MAVTDLTNTKWKWKNSGISITNDMVGVATNRITGNVTCNKGSFTCNQISLYPTIQSYTNRVSIQNYDASTYSVIYPALRYSSENGWEYKATSEGVYESASDVVIEVTGGAQATNTQVIYCFEANATQITSGGSMYLGTSTISKMYLGQNEVSKVYLGQDLVYEKQASGFSVSGKNYAIYTNCCYYSTDGGTTWIDASTIPTGQLNDFTITGITQFMVKCFENSNNEYGSMVWDNVSISGLDRSSSNPAVYDFGTLTADITGMELWSLLDEIKNERK